MIGVSTRDVKPGFWIKAGGRVGDPYPCMCDRKPCSWARCDCRGRQDLAHLPRGCCAVRSSGQPERPEAPRWGSGPRRGSAATRKPSESPAASAASVAAHRTGEQPSPWGEPPADTAPAWDAIDDAPPVVVHDTEAPSAAPAPPASLVNPPEAIESRPPVDIAALHCSCPTPWDAEPPALLIAEGKDGPVRQHTPLSAQPGADIRAEAEQLLAQSGRSLVKTWKEGRHALLPPADPASRVKTRPGWVAALADGHYAVLDVPAAPAGGGVHCGDCHRSFSNAGAYQVHRPRWDVECKDPASIFTVVGTQVEPGRINSGGELVPSRLVRVDRGMPLMKRTIGGVWSVDRLAPWGPSGPPMTPDEAGRFWKAAQDRLVAAPRWRFGRGHNR